MKLLSLNYMIFFQQLFDICSADLLQQLLDHHFLLETQVHFRQGLAVPKLDGGVQQITDVVDAAPDLGHTAVDVQQGVDSSMPVRMEYSVVKMVSRLVSAN